MRRKEIKMNKTKEIFIALLVVFSILLIGCSYYETFTPEKEAPPLETTALVKPETTAKPEITIAPETIVVEPETTVVETETTAIPEVTVEETTVTLGQTNAVKKAKSYLDFTSFSFNGLIDQLEYEGYTYEEALYGVENCGADWNEQAAKKAQSYLDFTSFSRQGLYEQLEYEEFTPEQIEYALTIVGY